MIATSHQCCLLLLLILPLIVTARSVPEVGTSTDIEGRVKKYSYYYISRKLYYIPLFFVVYWAFYVFWLIVQSIARHKVEIPLHWDPAKRAKRNIEALRVSVMDQIERFHQKFLVNSGKH
ncbi:uncharacterized protein LOC129789245 [Lutzomyia longipalpis]|uniref:uncharacterized protein LOC129789245 n=1 Tax=Lutzomyia longipalpis TaxID=7200 RepID=UPI002483E92A|nr:uncharacterized protein LOC129789245 [Lutzomyia longipalpis]